MPTRSSLSLLLLSLALTACSGGDLKTTPGNTTASNTVTVEVVDNGDLFSYQAPRNFAPQTMPETDLLPLEQQMFDALNAERRKGGSCYDPATRRTVQNKPAAPLKLEKRIYAAAQAHASDMVRLGFAGHLNPSDLDSRTPTRRMVKAGYRPLAPVQGSGQNLFFEESLAYGHLTPEEVLNAWKGESFDHCMTVYVDLTYGAVAVQKGLPDSKFTQYWVLNVSGNMPAP